MIEVKTQKRFKCDFCKKRSTKSVMALHEKRCFRNPNRYCDSCFNEGVIFDQVDYGMGVVEVERECPYCAKFDKKQLEEIEAREKSLQI